MRERNSRIDEKKEVVIKDDDHRYSCLLTDISSSGISVSSEHFIPTYKEIEVSLEINGKNVTMKGSVRWSIDADISKDKKGKLGILIMNPPPVFLEYVKAQGKT